MISLAKRRGNELEQLDAFNRIVAVTKKRFHKFVLCDNQEMKVKVNSLKDFIKEVIVKNFSEDFFSIKDYLEIIDVNNICYLNFENDNFRITRAILPTVYYSKVTKLHDKNDIFKKQNLNMPQNIVVLLNSEVPIILDKIKRRFLTRYCIARQRNSIILFVGKMPYLDYKLKNIEILWCGNAEIELKGKVKITFYYDQSENIDKVSSLIFHF